MTDKKNDSIAKINQLEKRLSVIEEKIKDLQQLTNRGFDKALPEKQVDFSGKKVLPLKGNKKNEFFVTVDSDLNLVDDKNNKYTLSEEQITTNSLVMGDSLLVSLKNKDTVDTIKVSQRAKRVKEDALVTEKNGVFYGVSKFGTHQLINYDVKSRGVLKGFEVKLLLPKDKEGMASVALIDFVEGSGREGANKNNINSSAPSENFEVYSSNTSNNPRVIEDDDLV